jgi:hypothetical protein
MMPVTLVNTSLRNSVISARMLELFLVRSWTRVGYTYDSRLRGL